MSRRGPSRPSDADRSTAAPHECGCAAASPKTVVGPDRRRLLQATLATGFVASFSRYAEAAPKSAKNERPQEGDRFVFASGDKEGTEIKPDDLQQGGPQVLAWPMDPETKTVRDGSRLNQVLLVRLDPTGFDDATKPHAADGIVAYSATCTHAQCPVTGWIEEKKVFHCPCHQSEFDPRQDGKAVFGPAPRSLPALPLKISDGVLVAAGIFTGRVGTRPA
jgi:rieske iron-sulfur protein